jgi:hypothetical protein
VGHGAVTRWATQLLTPGHVWTLLPGHGQPFVLSLDCLDGYWMLPPKYQVYGTNTRSLSEALLITPERGAVAVFAPAGMGTIVVEETMARAMFQALFQDGTVRLGELTQAGRDAISWSYQADIYTLFGDPATRLAILWRQAYVPLVVRD